MCKQEKSVGDDEDTLALKSMISFIWSKTVLYIMVTSHRQKGKNLLIIICAKKKLPLEANYRCSQNEKLEGTVINIVCTPINTFL